MAKNWVGKQVGVDDGVPDAADAFLGPGQCSIVGGFRGARLDIGGSAIVIRFSLGSESLRLQ